MSARIEPRWPVALSVLVMLVLAGALPEHQRAAPLWVSAAAAAVACLAMAGVTWSADKSRWLRIETLVLRLVAGITITAQVWSLGVVIHQVLGSVAQPSGLTLLTSGVNLWADIVIAFAVLFWQIDRGGPAGRMDEEARYADWIFPEEANPEAVRPGWQPTFVNYLFLSFETAAAFSAADALPLSSRARLLMMLESAICFTTLVVVASRAIAVLGT